MRASLTFLCSGLLFVSCGKPETEEARKDDPTSTKQALRMRHATREPVSDKPAELREILEEAVRIESPAAREKAIADAAWNALEIDPDLACGAFLLLSADNPEKLRLIQHYAMRLADSDPEEALEWASTLKTEQEIAAAKSQIALTIAETDPRRAADLLSESGIAGREFDVAVVQVVQHWAAQSPQDAASWAVLFPSGAAREASIRIIAEQWLPRDTSAAFAWLGGIRDEALRKETARAMEGIILQQNKATREAWLQHADPRIQSELEQQRAQAIKDVGDNIPKDTE